MTESKPTVLLFQDDFERMKDWVLQYPDRETGGQFFGLWTQSKNPYVNIVIGPGRECRHGTHSFHQDIDYLKNVGTFLNKEFMMCHIGEWHSHHRLRLRQPSSGDLNSIWKHFPSGVEHFLLVIATIESEEVKLWPYLFTASSHTHTKIEMKLIEKDNVFIQDNFVKNRIANGAEVNPEVTRPIGAKVDRGPKWFLTDWGATFVQHLNSELEKKVIDNSSSIEKTFNRTQSTLEFSLQTRSGCNILMHFPSDFPKSGLIVVCTPPNCKIPISWTEVMKHDRQSMTEFVDQIVEQILYKIPRVG